MITFYTLLGLTFIVFIHELGHFLVARWAGVKVFTFSIGIGPKLLRVFKDRKGTEYIISWIPLGGYVRMKGQDDLPGDQEEEIADDHYLAKSPIKRLAIIVAGVTMNTISAYFFIVAAYSIGVNFSSNQVGGFLPSVNPSTNPLKVGDEIVAVNDKTTETFEDVITMVALTEKEHKDDLILKVIRDNKLLEMKVPVVSSSSSGQEQYFPQLGILPKRVPEVRNLNHKSSLYLVHHLRDGDVVLGMKTRGENTITTIEGIQTYVIEHPGESITLEVEKVDGEVQLLENVIIGIKEVPNLGYSFQPVVEVIPGYPAEKAGIVNGDIIKSINGVAVSSWSEVVRMVKSSDSLDEQGRLTLVVDRQENNHSESNSQNHSVTHSVTVSPTYDPGSERYFLGVKQYQPKLEDGVRTISPPISQITLEMEQIKPGIRVGDQIISMQPLDQLIEVSLLRDDQEISFSYDRSLLAKREAGFLFDLTARGKVIRYGFVESLQKSFAITIKEFNEVITFFSRLVGGDVPLQVVGGPIAIFEASHEVAESRGWSYFILLLAKISISLAFINMLPIPVLDGGHVVLILYEMVRGKPMSESLVRRMQFVGLILLLTLMIYVNYNDITRLMNQ